MLDIKRLSGSDESCSIKQTNVFYLEFQSIICEDTYQIHSHVLALLYISLLHKLLWRILVQELVVSNNLLWNTIAL